VSVGPKGELIRGWPAIPPRWAVLASSPYPSAAIGLIACIAAWKSTLNANVFYITLLLAFYIFLQFTIVTAIRIRLVLLGLLLFFLLYVPTPRPAMPEVIQFVSATEKFRVIPPGGSRDYRFELQGIRDQTPQCGTMRTGELNIQGTQLTGAALRAPNVQISQQTVSPFYNISKLRAVIGFPTGIPVELNVTLVNAGDAPMTVKFGPEISGKTVYAEAAYMMFRSAECVIVAHSMPSSAAQ